ncbi:hypothetical protein D9M69_478740 [compost metagenome]
MHPLCRGQFLHVPVLGKQGHGLHRLVVQHRLEVFHQRKTRALHLGGSCFGTGLGTLDKALHGGFHAPEHLRGRHQPHHLQGAHGLVQLLASQAQRARIDRFQIVVPRLFGLTHKPPDSLVGTVERLAQFVEHPGERTEVDERRVRRQTVGGGVEHGDVWQLKPDLSVRRS